MFFEALVVGMFLSHTTWKAIESLPEESSTQYEQNKAEKYPVQSCVTECLEETKSESKQMAQSDSEDDTLDISEGDWVKLSRKIYFTDNRGKQ